MMSKIKSCFRFYFITLLLLFVSLTSSSWGAPDVNIPRDQQWSQVIDIETRGRENSAYRLFRELLLDLRIHLVGDWQGAHIQLPPGVTLPLIVAAPNESRSAFLAWALNILDDNRDPMLQRFIALMQLKEFKKRRLLRGWSPGVQAIMNALYVNRFGLRTREALISRLSRFDDEEALEALRRIVVYHPENRNYAIEALSQHQAWTVEDLELINYSLFASETQESRLAAIQAARQIQHPDVVSLLVDSLRFYKDRANLAGEPLNAAIQVSIAGALGDVGNQNRPVAIRALEEMNREAGLVHLAILQETSIISLALLGAFDRLPPCRADFCLGNSSMSERWSRVSRALNMSLDELIASSIFAHSPPISINGESLNPATLWHDFDSLLSQYHDWSPDLSAALRETLSCQLSPSAAEQIMLRAAPVIDSLRVLQRGGRLSNRFLGVPLSQFLLPR